MVPSIGLYAYIVMSSKMGFQLMFWVYYIESLISSLIIHPLLDWTSLFSGILQMEVLGKLLRKEQFMEMLSFQVKFNINVYTQFS
jgi:hypothetical protein